MMKRYCIFSAQYLPHMGGVERYTYYVAKKLVERGNKVTVVASAMEGEAMHEVQDGIEIYRLPCIWFVDHRFPVLKPGSVLKKIRKNLADRQFDLVIVNARFYIHSLYGQRFAKKNKMKCITIEHGTSYLKMHNPVLDILEHGYEQAISFLGEIYCENYYGVSQACCEWSKNFRLEPQGVLYNAVDLDEMEQYLEHPVKDYRKLFDIQPEDYVITFTGRMIQEKGILQLMDAVKKLQVRGRVVLFLAGTGPLEETVKRISTEQMQHPQEHQIIYLGQLDYPNVAALLHATDVFCLPSDSEGFPTSVLEAAAARCFVVTTRQGGAKELILDESYGMIMSDNYTGTIVDALTKALGSPGYRQKAVERTYARLKEEFTFDRTAEKIEKIADGTFQV